MGAKKMKIELDLIQTTSKIDRKKLKQAFQIIESQPVNSSEYIEAKRTIRRIKGKIKQDFVTDCLIGNEQLFVLVSKTRV